MNKELLPIPKLYNDVAEVLETQAMMRSIQRQLNREVVQARTVLEVLPP